MRISLLGCFIICLLASAVSAQSHQPYTAHSANHANNRSMTSVKTDKIEVSPTEVRLDSRRSYRQLVVTGLFKGESRDLTSIAVYHLSNARIAKMIGSRIQPVADGQTILSITAGGKTAHIPVVVSNAAKPDPVRFKFETLAILTKQGCATGSCHGSPHGKGNFSLSLFGYDPMIDRISLTRYGYNRRINVLEPSESLMLKKPLLEISHVGGKRFRKTDAAFHILNGWIEEGANVDLPAVECTRIVLTPNSARVLHSPSLQQQISVAAYYSDGTMRDITQIATYESSSPPISTVNQNGLVTGVSRGQAAISVRYLDKLQSLYFTVVEDVPGFHWKAPRENNYVDQLVDNKLKQLQYLPSGFCSDSVFIRRLYLDLTGLLPPPEVTRSFLQDSSPDKRNKRIDELLMSEEHARFWALKKADLMRITPARLKGGRAELFAQWIVDAMRSNMPYDQFAKSILTATGDTTKVPTANYFVAIPAVDERAEMTAQLFMGTRIECAKCHNHPFENWTMRDYYSIGAVFARTDTTGGVVKSAGTGESLHPTTGEVMLPWAKIHGSNLDTGDRRIAFTDWLTKPENPYFARVEVNRIWADLMGRGIVDPPDDFRSSNPPSNVPLLDALAADFVKNGYDRRKIIRLICSSRVYQQTTQTNHFNDTDESLFSRARARLLSAEQMKDAIGLASRAIENHPKSDPASKYPTAGTTANPLLATQRLYPEETQFMSVFGQPPRSSACTCERRQSPTLLQALELLNGGTAYSMAQTGSKSYLKFDNERFIEELYLSSLCRFPTEKERTTALKYLIKASNRADGVMDLIWTVFNTEEFLFQH